MDQKLVKFLDERGNIVKKIPLRHDEKFVKDGKKMYASDMAYISRNGEYVGISSYESELLGRNVKKEFTLLDNRGEVIWRKEITGHAIQNCKISDDGTRVLLVDEGIGRGEFPEIVPGFYIYGKGGIQVAQQKFDGELMNVVMSRNGKYVAGILTTGNIEGKTPPWQDFLVFYDIDKRKGWRYKLDGRIAISERGDVVVSGRDECVYSFTKEGELKWKHQIGDTNVRISDNGALVQARVFPSMEFYLYDNRNGNLLWKIDGPIKLPNNEHMQPFSIGLSREGNCVRLLNRPEKGEPLVFCILSLKKEIVEWTKLNLPQGLGRCSAFTSYDGKFLHVKSGYKPVRWFIYSLK
jgi:outer membrane protein assembly factor BamB